MSNSVGDWFKEHKGKVVEFRTAECPFTHRGKVLSATNGYVEMMIDNQKTCIVYKHLAMFQDLKRKTSG